MSFSPITRIASIPLFQPIQALTPTTHEHYLTPEPHRVPKETQRIDPIGDFARSPSRETRDFWRSPLQLPCIGFLNCLALAKWTSALPTDRSVGTLYSMRHGNTATTTDDIFFAVKELILSGGLTAVTLSAVCGRAGISKGGLMHHYASKETLVDAFISRSCEECLQLTKDRLQACEPGRGRRTRAFVDHILKDPAMVAGQESREVAAVMIALMQGGMSQHAMHYYEQLMAELNGDGLPIELLHTVVAAVDGLWMQSAFLPGELVAKRAKQVHQQLIQMIEDQARECPCE